MLLFLWSFLTRCSEIINVLFLGLHISGLLTETVVRIQIVELGVVQVNFKYINVVLFFVQLEQYKLVSQSFEKRVLDLQKEITSKDEEIASLQKANSDIQNSADHVRLDGWYHLFCNRSYKAFLFKTTLFDLYC